MPALANSTSAGRVRPSITRAAQRVTDKSLDPKAKPETDTWSSPVSESPSLQKVLRGYEHDRQRTKRTAETERLRERKERYRQAWLTSSHPSRTMPHGKRNVAFKSNLRALPVAEDEDDYGDENVPPETEEALETSAAETGAPPVQKELDLAFLIKPAKVRKHRGHDFEVVDNIPSVIVLEDRPDSDVELDEPWEHVTFEDDVVAPPSYAEVVVKA